MSEKRIRPVLRKIDAAEVAAVRAQTRLLESMRRAILAEIGQAVAFRKFHLRELLSAIDRELALGARGAHTAAGTAVRGAYDLGVSMALEQLPPGASLVGTSRGLVAAVIDVTTEQTTAVWAELGTKLKQAVRRATLGVTDPFDAIRSLAKVIRDPSTFGTAFARAEAIVRTEVNRAFSLASHVQMEQAAESARGYKVMKYWLTARDNRVREDHVEAGERYDIDHPIPQDEPFIVGGEELMYPLDPRGSPGNTIRCRCIAVPVILETEEAAA